VLKKIPLQWARDQRNGEQERDSDFGPEDYFESAMRGGHRGEQGVDQFSETMILVALCVMVSVLLYVRTRLVDRIRREQEVPVANGDAPQQQQQPQGQAMPPVGDAARDEIWGAIL
jgi:SEL1 protein